MAKATKLPTNKQIPCKKVGPGWTKVTKKGADDRHYTATWHSPVHRVSPKTTATVGGSAYYKLWAARQRQAAIAAAERPKTAEWINKKK